MIFHHEKLKHRHINQSNILVHITTFYLSKDLWFQAMSRVLHK